MFNKLFWKDTFERVLSTFAQALLVFLPVGVGVLDIDWVAAVSTSAGVAAASLLKSLVAAGVGAKGTPSLLPQDSDPVGSLKDNPATDR